jgi:hypothetical protein
MNQTSGARTVSGSRRAETRLKAAVFAESVLIDEGTEPEQNLDTDAIRSDR